MKKTIVLILVLSAKLGFAGVLSSDSLSPKLHWSTYFESYYTHDFGKVDEEKIRGIVNHSKNNEIAINLAMVRANYSAEKFRANVGLMIGSYSDNNYGGTDFAYKYIYESNVGIKLTQKHNLWFDVGIFPSHLGSESIIGMENWTLTRSLQAEASPNYEAGAKVSYTSKNEKWFLSIIGLNGWQVISKQRNYPMSLGTQIQYKPSNKILLNSSAYIGNNNSSLTGFVRPRYFHNFYTQIQWHKSFSTLIGFDIGAQEYWNRANYYYNWYSPIFIAKYTPNPTHSFAVRAEYFKDVSQLVFYTNSVFGFDGTGFSLNYDLRMNNYSMFRIEGKKYTSKDPVFLDYSGNGKTNTSITAAFIFHLND